MIDCGGSSMLSNETCFSARNLKILKSESTGLGECPSAPSCLARMGAALLGIVKNYDTADVGS